MDELFPTTAKTQLHNWLANEDDGAIAAWVTSVYHQPLQVYYSRCRAYDPRQAPADVVNTFFVQYLFPQAQAGRDPAAGGEPRPAVSYLRRWQAQADMPLHRFLVNGLWLSLRAERSRLRRQHALALDGSAAVLADEAAAPDPSPMAVFERALAENFVAVARRQAREQSLAAGQEAHWTAFERHVVDDEPFRRIAASLGVTPERARAMSRTAGRRFERALRDIVGRDRPGHEGVDGIIRTLMESLRE